MEPVVARKTWRTLEPLHGLIYFVPEADEEYVAVGLEANRMGYFASRSAAMGAVPAEVVIATFYNFNPELIRRVIPEAWRRAEPSVVLAARTRVADRALRRALGDAVTSPEMEEAAALARRAAEAACERPEGRPLFAAHASVAWPDEPHLVLWHAQTLLREFRGDAHVAALLEAGLDGVGALVSHAASGEVPAAVLQSTRAWGDEEWSAGVDRLRGRGLIADGEVEGGLQFTDAGRNQRQHIEDVTDARSVDGYAAIGDEGCERLRQLARPWSQAVVNGGLLGGR